jgi:hypothetical protein
MSTEPINPARFAAAIKDLPLSSLHLKVAELRNSLAHLDYSNEQLKIFADDTEGEHGPDQDCVDAIKENEVVIQRLLDRITLLKEEVEGRGSVWLEIQSAPELGEDKEVMDGQRPAQNLGLDHTEGADSRVGMEVGGGNGFWMDGTLQTGRIVNGEVRLNSVVSTSSTHLGGTNARLDDESLRQVMVEKMRALAEDVGNDEGMHL